MGPGPGGTPAEGGTQLRERWSGLGRVCVCACVRALLAGSVSIVLQHVSSVPAASLVPSGPGHAAVGRALGDPAVLTFAFQWEQTGLNTDR